MAALLGNDKTISYISEMTDSLDPVLRKRTPANPEKPSIAINGERVKGIRIKISCGRTLSRASWSSNSLALTIPERKGASGYPVDVHNISCL
jgi:hypothetical protein